MNHTDTPMNPVKWLLACVPATLPAAFVVMMLDSLSKEPHGPKLYIAVVVGSLLLTLFVEWCLWGRRSGPLGRVRDHFGIAFAAAGVIGVCVVVRLFVNGR